MRISVISRGCFYLAVGAVLFSLMFAQCVNAADEKPASAKSVVVSRQYPMMGTTVEIRVSVAKDKAAEAETAIEQARRDMEAFVHVVNAWDPTSDISRVNKNAGVAPVAVDSRLIKILAHAREISELSGGAFDVTYFPLGLVWNLRTANPVVPSAETIAEAKTLVNYKDLILDPAKGTAFLRRAGMYVELGALAKGAAVDAGIASLRKSGIANALVRGSGDMYAMGTKEDGPWTIGIRDPRGAQGEPMGAIRLTDRAATTSGDYEKMAIIDGKRYCHILDVRTGWPSDKLASVTVLGPDAETADALSTTFFILGPEESKALCAKLRVEALFIDPEGKITQTPGFPKLVE